jgi:hypothetical protein
MNPKSLQKTIMLGARNRDDHATPNPLEDYTVSIVKIGAPNPSLLKMQNRVDGGWFVAIIDGMGDFYALNIPGEVAN